MPGCGGVIFGTRQDLRPNFLYFYFGALYKSLIELETRRMAACFLGSALGTNGIANSAIRGRSNKIFVAISRHIQVFFSLGGFNA